MDELRSNLKTWLKSIGKNREWLARQCGVKKRTVDSWFSWGTITEQTEKHLRLLMCRYPVAGISQTLPEENTLTLSVDSETFDAWNVSAAKENKLLRQWAVDVLTKHATSANAHK